MHDEFPLPDPRDPLTRRFWEEAAQGRLAMPRCRRCRRLVWYPAPVCSCGGTAPEWETLSGTATLYTWTVVRRGFLPAFEASIPFVAGLVAVTEDPAVRLVTRIVGVDPDELTAGMPMAVVFEELTYPPDDWAVLAPFFGPAAG